MDTVQSNLVITHFVCSCTSEVQMIAMFGYPIGHAHPRLPESVQIIQLSSVDDDPISWLLDYITSYDSQKLVIISHNHHRIPKYLCEV